MMRLPRFSYSSPDTPREVVSILAQEGPAAKVVAGGTDLYPNMKRRQVEPAHVVSLRRVQALRGIDWQSDGALRIGPGETLRSIERDSRLKAELPALAAAVESISTPLLRNMGTIGGNLCLDTRCTYVNQSLEWRRAIHNCLKCKGDTCWTAPGSTKCWAVNSSDCVPVMIALGARYTLLGPYGEREIEAEEFYNVDDGREWLTLRPGELLTSILIPPQQGAKSAYLKLRRRGTFDFPVLGVAVRVAEEAGHVARADILLNAVGPAPVRCTEAENALRGAPLEDEQIEAAADLARKRAKPLQNTDFLANWRKKMVPVFVRRALDTLRTAAR